MIWVSACMVPQHVLKYECAETSMHEILKHDEVLVVAPSNSDIRS